jgi:DNA modification methylase
MTPMLSLPERSVTTLDTVHCMDALQFLRALPDNYVNCIVTSPPYFALRDYGVAGQIGLEDTMQAYIARLVAVFREARRVLRDDGVAFVNMGDSYAASRGNGASGVGEKQATNSGSLLGKLTPPAGLKPKDLMGIPWRLAFALQDDGWYLRQDIIWHKPNPMPESVTDRCTKAHEYVFLLSKSPRYWYDADAIREPAQPQTLERDKYKRTGYQKENRDGFVNHLDPNSGEYRDCSAGRNKRSVWTVAEPKVKLRSDIDPEKRAYVVGELLRRGLL